jgi:hypothetical protein
LSVVVVVVIGLGDFSEWTTGSEPAMWRRGVRHGQTRRGSPPPPAHG